MRTIYQQHRFKNIPITLVLFSAILMVGCSGYQSVSYYQDGIYGEAPLQEIPQQAVSTAPSQQQSGSYYKNYFAEKASQGIQDDYLFTNPEQYQSPTPEQTSAGNYQAHGSWGDQSDRINVNILYNRLLGWNWGWGWYDAPYTFGRSAFWGYNYHPWYFTFDHYHNPYYNPYRWGWGYRSPYWNRWNRWNRWDNRYPYWGNKYHNGSVYRNTPIYSRLNGSRTVRSNNSYSRNARSVNSNRTNARSTTRVNTNNNVQSDRNSPTTQQRQGVSTRNQTQRRTTTRSYDSNNNRNTTNSSQNNSSRSYSDGNAEYRSSSSNNSYRNSTPTRTTNSTRSSSPSRSSSSRRR